MLSMNNNLKRNHIGSFEFIYIKSESCHDSKKKLVVNKTNNFDIRGIKSSFINHKDSYLWHM